MSFRIRSKKLFLTYPKCNASRVDMVQGIKDLFGLNLNNWIVARELHKDGDPHLHVFVDLEKPLCTTKPDCCDVLGYHGNYQAVRSEKNVLLYCTKENDWEASFDIKSKLEEKKHLKRQVAELIKAGRSVQEVVEDFPEVIWDYSKLKANVELWERDKGGLKDPLPTWLPNPWGLLLWSKKNAKKRHLWIWSEKPNLGKTTKFGLPLLESYNGYLKSGDFTYWGVRGDEEFIILDDYNTAALKWSFLNQMADGTAEYRIFMGGVKRLKNPLIIILSNASIVDLYPHMNKFLTERFIEYKLD